MKTRKYVTLLLSAVMCLSMLSCGEKKPKPELTVESYTELQTVQKLPPVNIAGTWTEADIPGALWLGANRFSYPATFKSLSPKFSIDPEASDFSFSAQGEVTATLLYDGCACGTIKLQNCPSKDTYSSGLISEITFRDLGISSLPAPALFPVCFNGVTIGTSAADFKEKTGVELGVTGAEIATSHHIIQFKGSPAEGVTAITLISAD
ncbi:MAG: hypothetical protein J6Z40_13550 [Oscillospiraceae bacterium]|nr:hypothetical protein [Oscillospiraceae bacterium]MBQ5340172.1 hypothetical protein [Oscillospiraceae bacterium]